MSRTGLTRRLALVLALGLVALAAGCGGQGAGTSSQPAGGAQQQPAAAQPSGGGAGGGQQQAQPIKIGALYILSGRLALYGKAGSQGLQFAAEEINKQGGILGRPVEVKVIDEQGKPDVAAQEARRLILDEKVDALIGVDSSSSVLNVAQVVGELKKPLLVTHAATPKLVGEAWNPYVFRVNNDARMDAWAAAALAAKLPYKRWANIGPDYEFGRVSWQDFITRLKQLKPDVEVVGEAWPPFNAPDYTSHITSILNAQPEAVFSVIWGGDLVTFIRQAKGFGFFDKVKLFVDPVGASLSVLVPLGKDMPENLLVSTRYWFLYPETERNKNFVKAYYERFKEYPDYVAQEGYAALYMYKAAVEKAGTTDADAVVKALEGLSFDAPEGKKTIRPEDHQVFEDLVWGYTKHTDQYPFAILDRITVVPAADVTYPPQNKR
ncbi:ABC transporter substrate-binding protein [Caldinitratiruptor microaerophilus]|uniref:ABC transporter substrate-binding protein n=1 Tax=Caldinitratiruptor microaerophilus TaxID=671077 RepID=A0AA35CND7_9FIRM|nr:ABC transporter substrate-binding protein [Caldinitratiruptor microaerophilus]BDG60490.1 ABC transporter substrate-binding protein [Caldinitratiruptor microaerophilus]